MAKFVLDFFPTFDFDIVGICCHHKVYRLCWALNKELDLSFERAKAGLTERVNGKVIEFCLYKSENEEGEKVHLIQNKQGGNVLIPGLKHIDFFMIIFELKSSEKLTQRIRKIKDVLTAVEVNPESDKDLEKLIYE